MEKIFTAKTVDEAKELAAQEYGVSVDEIDFEILEQPRKGLFGLKGEAKVNAVYNAPAAETAAAEETSEEAAPASFEEDEADNSELPASVTKFNA